MAKAPPEDRDAKSSKRKASVEKQDDAKLGGEKPTADKSRRSAGGGARPATAFDLWLQRELQDMFSDVSSEPLPDDLLRLINESKAKK